jgi:hypothetical protein
MGLMAYGKETIGVVKTKREGDKQVRILNLRGKGMQGRPTFSLGRKITRQRKGKKTSSYPIIQNSWGRY